MDSSYILETGLPEVGILEIAVGYIKDSIRRSGLCEPNVYMVTEGIGDPKEISRQATSNYISAFHDYDRARLFGQRLCKLLRGNVATITALILMSGCVV